MSTRSRIGILETDGKIKSIYCHSDGYPSWNGRILLENYVNLDKIRELLSLGDLGTLGEEIGEKHQYDYKERPERQCTFFKRDGGANDVEAIEHNNLKKFFDYLNKSDQEYFYLWHVADSKWVWGEVEWRQKTKPSNSSIKDLTSEDVKGEG